jgi:DNA-directed RNA polymerase subunit RPC12/RpoP
MRVCAECGIEFDLYSMAKKMAGGLAIHCPDCSEEKVVRHAGVQSGDGKQASVQVLAFQRPEDRRNFLTYWAAATGLHTGKQCQMGKQPNSREFHFKKVTEYGVGMNHKGKS